MGKKSFAAVLQSVKAIGVSPQDAAVWEFAEAEFPR